MYDGKQFFFKFYTNSLNILSANEEHYFICVSTAAI